MQSFRQLTRRINLRTSIKSITTNLLLSKSYSVDSKSGLAKLPCGSQIFYEKAGDGGNVILCIPGALGTTQSDFFYQLRDLPKTFTVVSYDPRGYGKSVNCSRIFDEEFYHQDAKDGASLMKLLGFEKYSILGWSDGGICGIILAANNQIAVENLVVWGSNSYVSDEDARLIELTRDVNNWSERMRKPLEETYGKESFKKLWSDWVSGFLAFKERPEKGICIPELSEVKCPTLILHGQKDVMCPEFHADFIHERIAQSKLIKWADGKHNLHMKYNAEFNILITDFILGKQ